MTIITCTNNYLLRISLYFDKEFTCCLSLLIVVVVEAGRNLVCSFADRNLLFLFTCGSVVGIAFCVCTPLLVRFCRLGTLNVAGK